MVNHYLSLIDGKNVLQEPVHVEEETNFIVGENKNKQLLKMLPDKLDEKLVQSYICEICYFWNILNFQLKFQIFT